MKRFGLAIAAWLLSAGIAAAQVPPNVGGLMVPNTSSSLVIGGTLITGGTANCLLYGSNATPPKVQCDGPSLIYSAANSNFFVGPSAGTVSGVGPGNLALGIQAGAALTTFDPTVGVSIQGNTFIGYQSGVLVTQGNSDTFIGYQAGAAEVYGQENTFIGFQAGNLFSGAMSVVDNGQITAVGSFAFSRGTTVGHVAVGQKTLQSITSGTGNVAVGRHAGDTVTTATGDLYLGDHAGSSSTVTGGNNVIVGSNAFNGVTNGGGGNVVIGSQAGSAGATFTGNQNIFIGQLSGGNNGSGHDNVFIGNQAGQQNTTGLGNIYLGSLAGSTAPNNLSNTFIAGGTSNDRIDNVYFGKGYVNSTPTAYTINGTGGSGTDIAGADVQVGGGKGTGAGLGGKVRLQTALHGTTGAGLNSLTDGLVVDEVKNVVLNNAAIATNATDGFLYVASGAGTPTGVPTIFTGRVAMYLDTTNSQLWFYLGGAWKQPKTPAAAALVTWQ